MEEVHESGGKGADDVVAFECVIVMQIIGEEVDVGLDISAGENGDWGVFLILQAFEGITDGDGEQGLRDDGEGNKAPKARGEVGETSADHTREGTIDWTHQHRGEDDDEVTDI